MGSGQRWIDLRALMTKLYGPEPWGVPQYRALGRRLAKYSGRKSYTPDYIRMMLEGKVRVSNIVARSAGLLTAHLGGDPTPAGTQVAVQVAPGYSVPQGTLLLRNARLCPCGIWFIPNSWNHTYHLPACKDLV